MKITRRQLRRIIREAVEAESTFGKNAPHPLLADSYDGNGYTAALFEPIRDWLDEHHDESEETKLLHTILTGGIKMLPYVPFVFGDRALKKMRELGADREALEDIGFKSMRDQYEYNPPGW